MRRSFLSLCLVVVAASRDATYTDFSALKQIFMNIFGTESVYTEYRFFRRTIFFSNLVTNLNDETDSSEYSWFLIFLIR